MTSTQQSGEPRRRQGALGKSAAMVMYAVLLGLSYATLNDARLRLFSVAVVLAFAVLTWFHGSKPAPPPWGRPADLASGKEVDAGGAEEKVLPM